MQDLNSLIKKYGSLKYNPDKTKIICEWTGHEMPLKADAVKSYVNGSKYKKFLASKVDPDELKKFSEFLVPSTKPKREKQLFCKITWRHVNNQPDHIQRHLHGKRFQTYYQLYLECQKKNEKYCPPGRGTNAAKSKEADFSSDEGDIADNDSLSDLLPPDMLDHNNNDENNDAEEVNGNGMDIDEEMPKVGKRKLESKTSKKHKIEPKRKIKA